jgi:flagellar biogenesis protein FliO
MTTFKLATIVVAMMMPAAALADTPEHAQAPASTTQVQAPTTQTQASTRQAQTSRTQAPAPTTQAPTTQAPTTRASTTQAQAHPAPVQPIAPVGAAPAAPPRQNAVPASIKPTSFELIDRGDAVEVVARNVKASRTAILPLRSRLQVPIAGAPTAKRMLPGDATVKLIEIDSEDATRVLSVKLGFDYADVKALARFAQAIQVGDDLHVLFPRKLPSDGVTPRLPDPTLPTGLAAAVAKIDAAAALLDPKLESPRKLETKPDGKTDAKADAKTDAKADAKADPRTIAAAGVPSDDKIAAARGAKLDSAPATAAGTTHPTIPPAVSTGASDTTRPDAATTTATAKPAGDSKPLSHALASDADDTWSKISLYAAIGLAAAGAGVWLMRRRRSANAPTASIEILAQRSLGGKARIVWLSAGPREMIVSVTPQQVRVLGQWRKADAMNAMTVTNATNAMTSLSGAYTRHEARPPARAEVLDEPIATVDEMARGSERLIAPSISPPIFPAVSPPVSPAGAPTASPTISPAVTGILRLRRTAQMAAVSEELENSEVVADEQWAKEILAATGARR